MYKTLIVSVILTGLLLCDAVSAFAQSGEINIDSEQSYSMEAYRLGPEEYVKLDGNLDEPFWQTITPITQFTQQEPVEGGEPTEPTEIYIAYDSEYLYIGAKLYDSNPNRILAYQKRRNQGLGTDDRFMWILDTFDDGRNAYFFETNPAALRGDGLLTVGQGYNLNKSWDGIWDVRTSVTQEGWIAEIRIPFRTLDFDPNNGTWGMNFQRTIRRQNEEILWAGWRRNEGLFRPQNAGSLTGLEDIDQGIGLEVTPYVTGNADRNWSQTAGAEEEFSADTGFDLSYNITPSIRTSLTVNTDFAETEVDQRRVNLTRFPLFFPEQRDFFLEGSSIFSFAPRSGITPFFSRRIGLVEGEPIPLHAGIRLLGREGNTNLGFYQIRTGATDHVNGEDFTVARFTQNILSESNIGVIYTRRSTRNDDTFLNRHTLGTDLELSTSRFLGDKNLQFQAFFVWHNPHTAEETSDFFDRTSRGIRINYPNYPFYASSSYREFGASFDPAVGFASRVGFRRFQPTIGYTRVTSSISWLRSYDIQLRYEYLMNLDFEPETVNLTFSPIDFVFESDDRFRTRFSYNFERLPFDFDILRDGTIIIPAGDYENWSYDFTLQTARFRKLGGQLNVTYEGFWSGTRLRTDTGLSLRPFPGINLSAEWTRSDVNLPEGDFKTDLLRFNANIDLTPDIAFSTILQFDNLSEVLGLYNRFRWILTPGSDLYLVYTQNWRQLEDRFNPLEAQGAIKFNYTHRF